MEKHFKRLISLTLGVCLVLALPGCELFEKDDLASHEGQRELRAALVEFKGALERMNASPALMALDVLGTCFRMDRDGFSEEAQGDVPEALRQVATMMHLLANPHLLPLPGNRVIFGVAAYSAEETIELPVPGIYQYNFNTGRFDMLNPFVDHYEFRFPSSSHKKFAGERDAIFRFDQLVTLSRNKDCGAVDEIPTRLEACLLIGEEELLKASYHLVLGENGKPGMVSIQVDAPPYNMNLNYSGSGKRYNLVAKVRENEEDLIGINMYVDLCSSLSNADLVNGMVSLGGLKIDGRIRPLEIFGCNLDMAAMNDHLQVDVRNTNPNRLIGKIEFRPRNDLQQNTGLPELAIVYRDDTHEFLSDIFAEMFGRWPAAGS